MFMKQLRKSANQGRTWSKNAKNANVICVSCLSTKIPALSSDRMNQIDK